LNARAQKNILCSDEQNEEPILAQNAFLLIAIAKERKMLLYYF